VNRPDARNALNAETLTELDQALDQIARDPEVRAVVVTGAGEKAFVAGADIREIEALGSAVSGAEKSRQGQAVFRKLERLPKPVVVAINGFALGGGCELSLCGDVRLAAETAKIGLPEITLGILPGYGGTQRLPRLVGSGAAKQMIFTGEPVGAAEALRIGLVDRVVPPAELLPAALALAKKLAQSPPVALALAKRSIDDGLQVDLDRGLDLEAAQFGLACATQDKAEGTRAFLEKRPAVFTGR
jgi:enoyl-CoA hydratase